MLRIVTRPTNKTFIASRMVSGESAVWDWFFLCEKLSSNPFLLLHSPATVTEHPLSPLVYFPSLSSITRKEKVVHGAKECINGKIRFSRQVLKTKIYVIIKIKNDTELTCVVNFPIDRNTYRLKMQHPFY